MKTYLVSNAIDVSSMEGIEPLSIEDSISLIRSWPVVQFDTETTGLDARICKLTAMQFGYKDFKTGEQTAIVVDCLSISPEAYKYTIEHAYLIGQNLKFDLQFLYNHGIVPLQVYDTMICEQTLYLGYKPRSVSMSLANILLRHTGEEMDKSFQKVIAKKGLTEEGIRYAANDVVHLQDIRKSQLTIAESRNCKKAFIVENRFVPAIAYLEWCGVHLDEEKWKVKMAKDKAVLDDCLDKLNQYVMNHDKLQDFVSDYHEPSLFYEETGPYCTIDWASPAQCVPVFQALGFNTKVYDKVKKVEKDTVEEKVISLQKGIDDEFLKLYFDYKGAEKNVSTYGQGHLNQINPYTGRIHTIFNQIGTVTGRMSSGAGSGTVNKDLAKVKGLNPKEVGYCNLQNLPARGAIGKETRACFTSTGVNVFVSADYGAEESRVQADVWNEKSLLDSFANGIDTHNMYAKLCFPSELKDVDVRDVKKKRPDLRDKAKSAEFEFANLMAVMSYRKSGELLEA